MADVPLARPIFAAAPADSIAFVSLSAASTAPLLPANVLRQSHNRVRARRSCQRISAQRARVLIDASGARSMCSLVARQIIIMIIILVLVLVVVVVVVVVVVALVRPKLHLSPAARSQSEPIGAAT